MKPPPYRPLLRQGYRPSIPVGSRCAACLHVLQRIYITLSVTQGPLRRVFGDLYIARSKTQAPVRRGFGDFVYSLVNDPSTSPLCIRGIIYSLVKAPSTFAPVPQRFIQPGVSAILVSGLTVPLVVLNTKWQASSSQRSHPSASQHLRWGRGKRLP